jgi:hypothetical protein
MGRRPVAVVKCMYINMTKFKSGGLHWKHAVAWRYCGRGMMLTTCLHLAMRLRMSRVLLLLSLHAFLPWTGTTYPSFRPSPISVICIRLVLLKVTEPFYTAVIRML